MDKTKAQVKAIKNKITVKKMSQHAAEKQL